MQRAVPSDPLPRSPDRLGPGANKSRSREGSPDDGEGHRRRLVLQSDEFPDAGGGSTTSLSLEGLPPDRGATVGLGRAAPFRCSLSRQSYVRPETESAEET